MLDPHPINLDISWNDLNSIADACFLSLMRSVFSTNIKERHDHSTATADASGRSIVLTKQAPPIHPASMSGQMHCLLDQNGERIAPGDIFIGKDPHVAGGTRSPDINLATPVFAEGRLLGFVANIVLHADVCGAAVGAMPGGLDEIYKEGLRISIVRIYRAGTLVDDLMRLHLLDTRLPEERKGDLYVQIAAARPGDRRLQDLSQRERTAFLRAVFTKIVARTNR